MGGRALLSSHRKAHADPRFRNSRHLQTHSAIDFRCVEGHISQNRSVLRLQPGEGVKQWLMIKDPGPGGMRLRQVSLDMSFAEQFNVRHPDAYERLLMDVIRRDQSLFMRRDEVEAAGNGSIRSSPPGRKPNRRSRAILPARGRPAPLR